MKVSALIRTALCNLYQSVKRFPVTIFLAAVATVLLIMISRASETTVDQLSRLAMAAALGVPLTLIIALAFERVKSSKAAEYISYALALAMLALYYFFLLPDIHMLTMTRYMAVSLALYLTFLVVPYYFSRSGFEKYVIKVISRFLVTGVYSAVLFAGLAITLLTIDLLLGVTVSGVFYANVGFVVAGVFAPCFFLAGLPAIDQDMEPETYPSVLRVLLLYIVMPIILTYTAILYIYFLKTLFTLQWPEGTVSHLVLWYSVFSAGVILLIYPLVHENKFVKFFTVWFPRLILPAILVMFMAMGIRIHAYGVTENRYFVVALGLWVFGVMLYYNLTARFRNIVLPITLALIALLAVFGPWSAYTVSMYSQNARLEALAAEYDMIDGNTLHRPAQEISDQDKKTIVSILEYFSNSHKLSDVRLLPEGFEFEDMDQVFGFTWEDAWMPPGKQDFFQLHSQPSSLDIRGYDFLLNSGNLMEPVTIDGLTVNYSPKEMRLTILRGDQEVYAKDLRLFAAEVIEKHGLPFEELPAEEMTFVEENEDIQIKLVFTSISGEISPANEIKFADLGYYLLLRIKN